MCERLKGAQVTLAKMSSREIAFEHVTRQSVFLGLVRLHELRLKYPNANDAELICANAAGAASHRSADVALAAELIDAFALQGLDQSASAMRRFLREMLFNDPPPWIVAVLRGREALRTAMPRSVEQCFAFANLFAATPEREAVAWWDELVESQRIADGHALKDRGRDGERLTMHHELQRLSSLGIQKEPRWVALDDEWLGYDVLSFELDSSGRICHRLIEVKACSARPLRFFLTRNEWHRAKEVQDAYRLHVWHLPTEELIELGWHDIASHVPLDQGHGSWRETMIYVR